MTKKILVALLLICCILNVNASAVSMEQVQTALPDINVFVHSGGKDFSSLKTSDISATLDGEKLSVKDFSLSDEGIYYVFMVDVSRSIPARYLDSAKAAIQKAYDDLRPQDKFSVITFGDKVNVVLDGSQTADQVAEKIAAIQCTDNNTCFYDAMKALVSTASAQKNMRHVAVIISDGIEDAQTAMSQEDLEKTLREGGVAVYAMAVDTTSNANLDAFRGFVNVSGGELLTFNSDSAQTALDSLLKHIDEIWRLTLTSTAAADGNQHTLAVSFGTLGSVDTQVTAEGQSGDTTVPTVVSVDTDEAAGTITAVFSEPMSGLDKPECYKLTAPSGQAPAISVISAEGSKVVLSCKGVSKAEGWAITFTGLTDEANNPLEDCTVALGTVQTPSSTAKADSQEGLSPLIWIIIGAVVVAAVILVFILKGKHGKTSGKAEKAFAAAAPDITAEVQKTEDKKGTAAQKAEDKKNAAAQKAEDKKNAAAQKAEDKKNAAAQKAQNKKDAALFKTQAKRGFKQSSGKKNAQSQQGPKFIFTSADNSDSHNKDDV